MIRFFQNERWTILALSVALTVMSFWVLFNCNDIATVLNAGGINCAEGEHGAENLYMSSSASSDSRRLVLSYTCHNGKAVFEVRP